MTTPTAVLVLVAAWAGALLGHAVVVEDGPGNLPAVSATTGVLVVALAAARRQPRRTVALALLAVLSVTTLGAAVRAEALHHGPLIRQVPHDGRRAVELVVTAVGDVHRPPEGSDWVLGRLASVGPAGGAEVRSIERVLLRVPRGPGPGVAFGGTYRVRGVASRLQGPSADRFARQGVVVAVQATDLTPSRDPPRWQSATTRLRERLRDAAHRHLPVDEGSLLTGLVTGDLTGQPPQVEEDVTDAGLSHLVAVSGSNVAVVAAAVLALVLALGCSRRAGWTAAVGVIWWFVVLVRAEPSVVRAASMASLVLVALLVGRVRSTPQLLCTAGTLALLADPLLARRVGFLLSVAATAGVVVLAPTIDRLLHDRTPLPQVIRRVLAATCGAQLAVAPVLVAIGGAVHVASVPANLIAVPAAGVAGAIGSVVALLALVMPRTAGVVAIAARPVLEVVLHSAQVFASAGGRRASTALALLVLAAGLAQLLRWWTAWAVDGAGGWWGGARAAREGSSGGGASSGPQGGQHAADPHPAAGSWQRRIALGGPVVLVSLVVVLGGPPGAGGGGAPPPHPLLVVLDVGQGDALLVGDPIGGWLLVDGGPDPAALEEGLRRHGITALAGVVVSHPHADHTAGLIGVLGDMSVGGLVIGPRGEQAAEVLAAAADAGVPVVRVAAGDGWAHGSTAVAVLSPPAVGLGEEPNDNSLVLRLDTAGGSTALLTGDVEVIGQRRLLDDPRIDVDLLKVPHHGGATNALGFLAATTPEVAIISAGESNPFGHPHPDVLAELAGITVFRTDLQGDVILTLD